MHAIIKTGLAVIVAAGTLVATQATARDYRPAYCPTTHDHRSHDANYYDYYDQDRYSRAGAYNARSDYRGRDNYRGRRDYRRGDRYRGRGYYRPRSEVVFKKNLNTRYDAYITVVEENYWTRSGRVQRVCSVVPKGPEAYYIPQRRLERVANRNCSRRARVQFL